MIVQRLRRVGDADALLLPTDEVERLGWREGQTVSVGIRPREDDVGVPPDLRAAFEASWEEREEAYRYLAER